MQNCPVEDETGAFLSIFCYNKTVNTTDTQKLTPFTADDYLHAIPEAHRASIQGDYYFKRMLEQLNEDPDTANLYKSTVLEKDQTLLLEKTKKQQNNLSDLYFGKALPLETENLTDAVSMRTERTEKQLRLVQFEKFISDMSVIKGGRSDLNGSAFVSRNVSDPNNAFSQNYDIPLCAHTYTYCSFDELSHPQAIGAAEYDDVSVIDDSDLQGRAEILTMDIADLDVTATTLKKNHMKLFMDNTFDFEGGKKVLALYCAIVFKDVHEAQDFFHRNCGRSVAENWYKSPAFRENLLNTIDASDDFEREHAKKLSSMKDAQGISMNDISINDGRIFDIQKAMIDIFERTNIVPPLTLEVRIPDYANVKEGGKFHNWLSDV